MVTSVRGKYMEKKADRDALLKRVSDYTYYQTIDLGDGVKTPGLPLGKVQEQVLSNVYSMDLKGKRVVDLGCANGLFAFEAEKRGPKEILAVDHTRQNIEAMEQVTVPLLSSKVKPVLSNVMDFQSDTYGKFDLVIFAGVLYYLRFPFWALRIVKDLVADGGTLLLETAFFDVSNTKAVLYCPSTLPGRSEKRLSQMACAFFNERALLELLEYFGLRVQSKVVVNKRWKRLGKRVLGNLVPSYVPISNIVLRCERDSSLEVERTTDFYEGLRTLKSPSSGDKKVQTSSSG